MKALQVIEGREFRILEVEKPVPKPGEARLKVEGITICAQWDLHLRHNSPMFPGHQFVYPYTVGQPGHEATGVIDAVGEGETDLAVGDRVSIWRDPGHDVPGAYAEYVVRSTNDFIKVPKNLDASSTASVELAMCVACSLLMMRQMDVIKGKHIGVMGLGPAGLIAVQMMKAEGALRVTGFDTDATRRQKAIELGADDVMDTKTASDRGIQSRPDAVLDSAIDCVGAKATVEFLLDHVKDVVAIFGVLRETIDFRPSHFVSVRLCGYPMHHRAAAEYAVGLIERGALNLAPLVTHRLPMSEYDRAIDRLEKQEAIKILLDPSR